MQSDTTPSITVNPRTVSRHEKAWAPRDIHDAMAQARLEHDEWKATAEPIVVVGLDLPFGAVANLYVQFLVLQLIVAGIVVAVLFALGVL